VGESGPEEDGERLNLTDFVGGGCEVALRCKGGRPGRDGDWARGVLIPTVKTCQQTRLIQNCTTNVRVGTHPPLTIYWARSKKVHHWSHREEHRCWERWECQHSHSHHPSWVPSAAG